MDYEYRYTKKKIDKNEIDKIQIYFDNGDFVTINKNEVIDCLLDFSDKLLWNNNKINQCVSSGYIRLKILKSNKTKQYEANVYNTKEYVGDRKSYIENRCTKIGSIQFIVILNEYNWDKTLLGDIVAERDNEFLILNFKESYKYPNKQDYSCIQLNNINKSGIYSLNLDFENCEGFSVSQDEILDINLKFNEQLVEVGGDLCRTIKSGYVIIKLDDKIDKRPNGFSEDATNKYLMKRICGKGFSMHDICNLYIEYDSGTVMKEEHIDIEDIRPAEILEPYDESGEIPDDGWWFVGGYAKSDGKGVIKIAFGNKSEETIKKL